MATLVVMEVLSLGMTFRNEWNFLWREWPSIMPLLSNKSISEVFLTPFWYVNVELEVRKPISLTMFELVTRLWMPSTTRELIKCLSKMLDGTLVACGLRISKRLDVVFKVSFNIAIMSLVFSFKSWKLNNDVFTCFCAISHIWSWHSIRWSMENCVFSWCTCAFGTQEFDALVLPPRQQGEFFFCVERRKKLWHDSLSSFSPNKKTWIRCKSINMNYMPSGRKSRCQTSLLCQQVGRAKRSGKFWCETIIMCTRMNILPNHGIMWKAIEWPRRFLSSSWTLYRLGMISWLGKLGF